MNDYPFVKCLHPKRIQNPHTGEYLTVGCGKCVACRMSKSSHNTLRCKLESKQHRYCMFVTLTYDEQHVPRFTFIPCDGLKEYYAVCVTERVGEGMILGNLDITFDAVKMLQEKVENRYFPFLWKRDVQLFIKRFRKHLSKYTNEKIRYYVIGEYGPVHFRPHYHLLLWFSREELQTHS